MEHTAILATFYKTAGKRIHMDSLTVLTRDDTEKGSGHHLEHYDVDWSRAYRSYIFHQSASGWDKGRATVSGIYFLDRDFPVREKPAQFVDASDSPPWKGKKTLAIRERNRTQRIARLPAPIILEEGKTLLEWLQENGIEDDSVYCTKCRDYVTGQDGCEHVWWCNQTGDYSTPEERCSCKSRRGCACGDEDEDDE